MATIINTVEKPNSSAIIPPKKGTSVKGKSIVLVSAIYAGLLTSETISSRYPVKPSQFPSNIPAINTMMINNGIMNETLT